MEMIINDLSIDGQFRNIDDFIESIFEHTIPVLKILEKQDSCNILKSYYTYSLSILGNTSLADIMKLKGSAEISLLKSYLKKHYLQDPYWEDNKMCKADSTYLCEYTDKTTDYCLAEAVERDVPVLSFEHHMFKDSFINIQKDGEKCNVGNIYSPQQLQGYLLSQIALDEASYIINKFNLADSFLNSEGEDLYNEFVRTNNLIRKDIEEIINQIEMFFDLYNDKMDLMHFSEHMEGKLYQFRCSISNRREIRIFYVNKEDNVIFLNAFVKKTEQTPERELSRARRLAAKYV